MASTYSSSLRLELIATGEQANTWGITTNTNLGTLIEQAISGYSTVNMATDADRTLTTSNGSTDESRPAALKITSSGSLSVTRNIIVPTVNKLYSIKNATTGGQSILVKTVAGTGITIPNGETATVICDGTNVVYGFTPAGMGVPTTYAATAISNTPAGNIAATNVQAAINELDTEKAKSGANSDITSLTALASVNGFSLTGLLNVNDGADIASATTVDLTAAIGNTVRITGTTPITAFTMNAGQQMELVAVGALPLTYHATTMNINGGASYTCSANDRLSVFKDGAGVIQVNVTKQDGSAIMSGLGLGYGQTWQDVLGSRTRGTTYYNTTGKPIITVIATSGGTGSEILSVNSINVGRTGGTVAYNQISAVVPAGESYVLGAGTATIGYWAELR